MLLPGKHDSKTGTRKGQNKRRVGGVDMAEFLRQIHRHQKSNDHTQSLPHQQNWVLRRSRIVVKQDRRGCRRQTMVKHATCRPEDF
jgi:hypothetical protein